MAQGLNPRQLGGSLLLVCIFVVSKTMAQGLNPRQIGGSLLLVCIFAVSKILLEGQQLCNQFCLGSRRSTTPPRSTFNTTTRPLSCPDLPEPLANTTINPLETSPFDRPGELEALLSSPNMRMPSAHNVTGLRIALIGDSVSRYISTSLAFYLRFNTWLSDDVQPNILSHNTFETWDHLANYSVHLFGGEPEFFFPCDCYGPWKRITAVYYDNRYYRDKCRDNSISFISKLGSQPFKGHWRPDENFTRPKVYGSPALLNSQTPVWQYNTWPELLQNYITQLVPKPDYVVINEGLWRKHGFQGVRDGTSVFTEIRRILDDFDIHGIYRTTTTAVENSSGGVQEGHDEFGCKALHSCLEMNWTAALHGDAHYVDQLHFRPHVNRWFVEQLWDHLAQIESERQQVIET